MTIYTQTDLSLIHRRLPGGVRKYREILRVYGPALRVYSCPWIRCIRAGHAVYAEDPISYLNVDQPS
jgi:hypothetical protein